MLSNLVSRYFHEVNTYCHLDRYHVKVVPKSGIRNNPNHWADELGNQTYILDLLLRIINASVKTVDIVNGLPKIDFTSQT